MERKSEINTYSFPCFIVVHGFLSLTGGGGGGGD